jgi:hypothetical protein
LGGKKRRNRKRKKRERKKKTIDRNGNTRKHAYPTVFISNVQNSDRWIMSKFVRGMLKEFHEHAWVRTARDASKLYIPQYFTVESCYTYDPSIQPVYDQNDVATHCETAWGFLLHAADGAYIDVVVVWQSRMCGSCVKHFPLQWHGSYM